LDVAPAVAFIGTPCQGDAGSVDWAGGRALCQACGPILCVPGICKRALLGGPDVGENTIEGLLPGLTMVEKGGTPLSGFE